jgi:hypothetical protein
MHIIPHVINAKHRETQVLGYRGQTGDRRTQLTQPLKWHEELLASFSEVQHVPAQPTSGRDPTRDCALPIQGRSQSLEPLLECETAAGELL